MDDYMWGELVMSPHAHEQVNGGKYGLWQDSSRTIGNRNASVTDISLLAMAIKGE